MGNVKPITSFDEFTTLINSGKTVIIDFWATWCGPCRAISPIFERLSEEEAFATAGVEFYKVDVDEQQQISEEVKIKAMPTFIAFKDGNVIEQMIGANPNQLMALVNKFKA
ncbi:thioredoxin [Fistulina hepatica ATCC 64428]|uniref:Thioredoxin n=1 Tax=Fistulina hepatica ATCC 64428 TaxID=1128425 RepID=A0A0D7AGH3_9AGAR|nr:thioredoxin [Fistulina hepatica ATCC 64428]